MVCRLLFYIFCVFFTLKALGQNYPGARKVTFSQKDITVEELFRKIYEQTGMTAFYNDEQLNSYIKVSVDFSNEPLDNVLARLLRKRGMAWCYRKEVFVIAYKREGDLDLGTIPGEEFRLITGRVRTEKGEPLEQVVITTPDKRKGTITSKQGFFSIRDVAPRASLLFQRMGYRPILLSTYPDSLDIHMTAIVAPLQPVSITGRLHGNLTGSVSSVSSKEIAESPVSNVLGALQGRVPGLFLNQTTGLPGGGYRIRLRGRNSIESNSEPLILVDGIPFPAVSFNENYFASGTTTGANVAASPLNLLSVSDIASVQIIKDGDASSLYGTKGVNGVILITSKSPDFSGKKLQATVNYYTGIGKASNLVRYLDTKGYLAMRREAIGNDNRSPDSTLDFDLMVWDTARYRDWQKIMIGQAASISDGSLELKGGFSPFAYRASGFYRRETTVYPSKDFNYQKGGMQWQLWYKSRDERLRLNLSASYASDHNRLPLTDVTVYSAITPPNAPDVYSNGKLNFAGGNFLNPYAFMQQVTDTRTRNFRPVLDLFWEPVKSLTLSLKAGGSSISIMEAQRSPAISFNPASGVDYGVAQFMKNSYSNGLLDLRTTWKQDFSKHQLNLTAGARFQFEHQDKGAWFAAGYGASDMLLSDTTGASQVMLIESIRNNFQYQSFYGRLEYKYDDRYLLSLTFNRDGSTRLGRPYGSFGAIGAGWIFTREKWLKPGKVISFGKLRASYSLTGNDQFQWDLDRSAWVPGQAFSGGSYSTAPQDGVPAYSWECTRKAEAALDIGLFADRISATICYYNNHSSNQILSGRFQGFMDGGPNNRFYPVNVGAVVENKGLELDLEGIVLQNKGLAWTTSLNLSIPRNRLLYFPFLEQSAYRSFYSEGKALDMIKGYHLRGVDPTTGIYQFEDIAQNGLTLREDGRFATETGPFLYGGFYNNFRYKNVELSFLLRYTRQNNYSYLYFPSSYSPGGVGNQPLSVLDRWQQTGDQATLQRYTTSLSTPAGRAFARALTSDQRLTDASYLRLQSLTLAYYCPQKLASRLKLKSCKLYLQGLNLLTITRYLGRDPEVTAGPDTYPSLRVITAGIQLSL